MKSLILPFLFLGDPVLHSSLDAEVVQISENTETHGTVYYEDSKIGVHALLRAFPRLKSVTYLPYHGYLILEGEDGYEPGSLEVDTAIRLWLDKNLYLSAVYRVSAGYHHTYGGISVNVDFGGKHRLKSLNPFEIPREVTAKKLTIHD